MARKFSYYSFDAVMSRNAVLNMVMGARGLGKTYGAKKFVINNAIRKGEQFIYLRRYRSELKNKQNFFDDISVAFPGYEFRVNGSVAEMRMVSDKEWSAIGYFVALSVSQANKSVAYPAVTTIIFDEFIIERGSVRYIPGEVQTLLNFYSTVDRWQDKTRVLMLSNAVSIMNPYFIQYDIDPSYGEFVMRGDGFICAHFVDSKQFASEVARTRFGQFIINYDEGYASYSISNEFVDHNDDFVLKKNGNARYVLTMRTSQGVFSIWMDGLTVFVQKKRPKGDEILYTLCSDIRAGERMLTYSDKTLQILRARYKHGRVFFDSPSTRNSFREIFKR